MPQELRDLYLEGVDESVESFILSRPSASGPYLISAALECLRERAPMNEAGAMRGAVPPNRRARLGGDLWYNSCHKEPLLFGQKERCMKVETSCHSKAKSVSLLGLRSGNRV